MTVTIACGHDDRLGLALGGQQHGELVAAQARTMSNARRRCCSARGAGHELVADPVAVAVVDLLEAVQVQEQHRELVVRRRASSARGELHPSKWRRLSSPVSGS